MNSILQGILGSLLVYRYVALLGVTFLSSLGFPLPAAPSVIAASAFASQGYLNIVVVFLVGATGNIAGDFSMYWLVRKFGRKVLVFFGLRKLLQTKALQNAETAINYYKAPVLIVSRFQVQATAVINILYGLGKLNFKRFAFYVAIGESLQMLFFSAIGYFFSENWQTFYSAIGKFTWIVATVLAITFLLISTKVASKVLNRE